MTVKQIEDQFGLPAIIRIPLQPKLSINSFGHKTVTQDFLHRTITKRLENGHYLQYDETQPHLGEFQCCYEEETPHNDWEYVGKPTKEQLPFDLGANNGRNE